jgi:hypothetical protein
VPGIVHHVQLWALDDDQSEAMLDALDAADPGVGYTCEAGHGLLSARYVSVWAPSDPVRRHPPGTGMLLHAGHRMLVQIHYHDHDGIGLPDQTAIELELEPSVERPASMWVVSTGDIELPPGARETTVEASYQVPEQVSLWGVRAHMHAHGSHARVERGASAASDDCLLDIPRWDPNWQLMYFYDAPTLLGPGDQLRVDCSYDTRNADAVIRYGTRTSDEMCFGYFYVTAP